MNRLDERWEEILDWTRIPRHPRTYVLGCSARHVTFYSQQVRALNLIEALCNSGRLREGDRLVVVGGGLAGITAAAGALRRRLEVTLFEKQGTDFESALMNVQFSSEERHVDPHVYDWPPPKDEDPGVSAGLPLLDWTAKTADKVRTDVVKSFRAIVERAGDKFECVGDKIEQGDVEWSADLVRVTRPSDASVVEASALILAVGFGLEDEGHTGKSYWRNDGLDHAQADNKTYLISGSGDGGLTDLMRGCIKGFRHRDVLDAARRAEVRESAAEAQVAEQAFLEAHDDERAERQQALTARILEAGKKLSFDYQARSNEVLLVSTPDRVFSGSASILNRLIVAKLWIDGAFRMVDAYLNTPVRPDAVEFLDKLGEPLDGPETHHFGEENGAVAKTQFDVVIVRHGPGAIDPQSESPSLTRVSPFEESFPKLFEATASQRERWRTTSHWLDRTRRPFWSGSSFLETSPRLSMVPDRNLEGRDACVITHADDDAKQLVSQTEYAVAELTESKRKPIHVDVDGVFREDEPEESAIRFAHAIRTVCRAPTAIFDFTEPAKIPLTMLLLGVRAAARRGVTVLAESLADGPSQELPEFLLDENVPFNLADASRLGRGPGFKEALYATIDEGHARLRNLGASYHDLPGHQTVRALGPDSRFADTVSWDDEVLLLTSFDKSYRLGSDEGRATSASQWSALRDELGHVFQMTLKNKANFAWINQSSSPELISVKLYSSLRRHQLCVVDLTKGSPNVLFELGFRLAVNENPPLCFLHEAEKSRLQKASWGFTRLLSPIEYGPELTDEFQASVDDYLTAMRDGRLKQDWPRAGALLSPGFVYRLVRDSIDPREEWFGTELSETLRREASMLLPEDEEAQAGPLYLFHDRPEIRKLAERGARDRRIAAWSYLDARHRLSERLQRGELGAEDFSEAGAAKDWWDIGNVLRDQLEGKSDYARLHEEIQKTLRRIEQAKET